MVEYGKVNVKLSDTQLEKLKPVVKDKTETTLRMSLKIRNRVSLMVVKLQSALCSVELPVKMTQFQRFYLF